MQELLFSALLILSTVVILIITQLIILKYYILPKILDKTESLHKTLHPDLTKLVKLLESMIKRLVTIHINIKNYVINTTDLRTKLIVVIDALPYSTSNVLDARFMVALRLMSDVVVDLYVDSKTSKTKTICIESIDKTVKTVLSIVKFVGIATPKLLESLEFSIRVSISSLRLSEKELTVDSVAEVYTELFKEFYEEFKLEFLSGRLEHKVEAVKTGQKTRLHELVADNRYTEAIETLKQFEDIPEKIVTMLSGKYNHILEKIHTGSISSDEESLELTRLRLSILDATHYIRL